LPINETNRTIKTNKMLTFVSLLPLHIFLHLVIEKTFLVNNMIYVKLSDVEMFFIHLNFYTEVLGAKKLDV